MCWTRSKRRSFENWTNSMENAWLCSASIHKATRSIHRRQCCISKWSPRLSSFTKIEVNVREGITNIIQSRILELMPSLAKQSFKIDYHRVSSNHYSIPPYSTIDSFRFLSRLMLRLLQIVQSFPDKTDSSCTILVLAHNLGGLLFHLPLFMLFFTHIQAESNPILDSSTLFGNSPLHSIECRWWRRRGHVSLLDHIFHVFKHHHRSLQASLSRLFAFVSRV